MQYLTDHGRNIKFRCLSLESDSPGKQPLLITEFMGEEAISSPFRFELHFISESLYQADELLSR